MYICLLSTGIRINIRESGERVGIIQTAVFVVVTVLLELSS